MGTLWYGGKFYTMEKEGQTVEAVFTEGNRIRAAGKEKELRDLYAGSIDDEIHCGEKTVLPGLTDSHLHLIGHGEKLGRLDFSQMQSHEEIKAALAEKIASVPAGEWIIGEGWNEHQLAEGEMFDRTVLDELSSSHPIVLKRICRHAILANSKALGLAGITDGSESPAGGIIGRRADGTVSGFLMDRAQDIVLFDTIPPVSLNDLKKALNLAVKDCFRYGLTGGHSEDLSYYGNFNLPVQAYHAVITEEMPFKAHLLVHHLVIDDFEKAAPANQRLIEYGAMKIFADGSLGGSTALLSEPYLDDPGTNGVAVHTQEQLNELVRKAREYGREIAIHVIGDLAYQMALNAVEIHPPAAEGQKDRFIHAQVLTPELMKRTVALPIMLDIQPGFTASDFPWIFDKLGEKRLKTSFAWKTLLEMGIGCAGGSDAPIEPLNPFIGIHAAVARKSIHTPDEPGYFMEEALSVYEALQLYTTGSAEIIHRGGERGKLKEGYDADLIVLNQDPFKLEDPDKLLDTEVLLTVAEGKMVYLKPDSLFSNGKESKKP
ncbi:amidohydrolase family protein [Bacillus mangrovi]|uniref:Amidohydrolase family protein n=1 Tax=Metabacillus mangrovi TaxID=1491830 RepID=A0A7X2S376_9BACI|nr:amidohydrolase [Metabacillus mangrovi]MTH52832.1 amidohydrolase family protein [Metabacillus mangrovi]